MEDLTDLIITIAHFSISVQILVSLWKYPPVSLMSSKIFLLLVLFALFVFLCGTGHLMQYLNRADSYIFAVINISTSAVSLVTALYLMPLIPHLLGCLDEGLQDLVKLNAETAESNTKLINFMAFLCHEIRNPLFAITSSTSFLGDTELTEEQRAGVSSVLDSSKLMLRLVNDVLELSKIDAGKLELENRDFDLRRLLENLETTVRMQIRKKHGTAVDFRFSVSTDVPRFVRGDSMRILQIIFNLLSNSNKFTEKGHIELIVGVHHEKKGTPTGEATEEISSGVSLSSLAPVVIFDKNERQIAQKALLNEHDDNNSMSDSDLLCAYESASDLVDAAEEGKSKLLVDSSSGNISSDMAILSIVVSDTGIGIAPERIRTIFEPYSQAKLSDYRKHGGTGLGLSILSSIIKIMGGSIKVWSEVGVGTRFFLRLPLKMVPNQDCVDLVDTEVDMIDPLGSCRRLPVYNLAEDSAHQRQPSGIPDSNTDVDMSDGMNVCLRLPVHKLAEDDIPQKRLSSGTTDFPDVPHSDDAGIEFFVESLCPKESGEGVTEMSSGGAVASKGNQPMHQITKAVSEATPPKKPKFPKFNLPPSDCVVLVVDDNCVNRKIIGRMLTSFGVEFEEAVDGLEAVEAVRRSRDVMGDPAAPRFALVFMDLCMPVMDGYEAIGKIRREALLTSFLPIVALTANALSQERRRALELGANEFHTKPILREDLYSICKRFLQPPDACATETEGRMMKVSK